jgi:peptidoglycan hydrolase-like protein with peptidoglycan-binding domain
MVAPLVLGLGAGAVGLIGYKLYEDSHPKVQSLRHTDPATGKPVQVIVPVKAPKPVAHVSTVPIAGQNAQVIWGSSTGVKYVPPTVIKQNQTPGRLDLLPTVITPTGASSLAVMTLADVQNALNTLGFGPLMVDGKLGQATQAAVAHYQQKAGLGADGNPGPQTKASLQHALADLASPGRALGVHPAVVNATPQTPAQVAAAVTGNVASGLVSQATQDPGVQKALAVASTAGQVAQGVSSLARMFSGVDADPRYDPLYASVGPAGTVFYPDRPAPPALRTRRALSFEYGRQRRDHVETLGDVQEALNRLGASPELGVTGTLNPQSVAAVKAFQITHGLLADGVPGPKTRTALTLALLGAGQSSEFGLTLFTLFGAEPPPVGSRFGLARASARRPAPPGGGASGRGAHAVQGGASRSGRKRRHHHHDQDQQQQQQQDPSGGGGGGDQGGGGGGGDGGGGGGDDGGGDDGGDNGSDVSGERAFG